MMLMSLCANGVYSPIVAGQHIDELCTVFHSSTTRSSGLSSTDGSAVDLVFEADERACVHVGSGVGCAVMDESFECAFST